MRNLKRVLSLALACVMVIGMMVMTTGAADFSDSTEIDYTEAVDVISALGIIEGIANGDDTYRFNPDGILTREGAAKLICCMMVGKENAKMLTATKTFSDVKATSWSAPYISYCVSLGYIAGNGDGTFSPEGKLTGLAFAKLLLCALGYDAQVEGYVGKNWATNIAADAFDAGLNIPGVNLNDYLTREQAAQMMLNAIKAPLVEYDNKGSSITVNGAEINFGSSKSEYVTTALAKEQRISDQKLSNNGEYTVEFGEKYMPGLFLNYGYSDAFGRPTHLWTYQTVDVGFYPDSDLLVKEYKGAVKGSTIYTDIGYSAISKYDVEVFVDGAVSDPYTSDDLNRTASWLGNAGAGSVTEVYVDHDKEEITFVHINTYLAEAAFDYNIKTETVTLNVFTGIVDEDDDKNPEAVVASHKISVDDFALVEGMKQEDKVLVTMAAPGHDGSKGYNMYSVMSVAAPEIVPGVSISSYSDAEASKEDTDIYALSSITADGVKYSASAKAVDEVELLFNYNKTQLKDTYNLYLDTQGNVLGIELVEEADQYVFVVGYEVGSSVLAQAIDKALIITTEGEMKTVNATDDVRGGGSHFDNSDAAVNTWFTYEIKADGTYVLGAKAVKQGATTLAAHINSENVTLAYGVDTSDPADGSADVAGYAYGNDATTYITVKADASVAKPDNVGANDGSIVKINGVYTGIKNVDIVPQDITALDNFTGAGAENAAYDNVTNDFNHAFFLYNGAGYVTHAVVVGEDNANNENMVYLTSGIKSKDIDAKGTYYYVYSAIVNGEATTIKSEVSKDTATADLVKDTLYEATFDVKTGYVTSMEKKGETDPWNTNAHKGNGYAVKVDSVSALGNDDVYVTLQDATLWVIDEQANDNYVLTTDETVFFVKNTINGYDLVDTARAAVAATKADNVNYIKSISVICDNTTGYAKVVIIDLAYVSGGGGGAGAGNITVTVTGSTVTVSDSTDESAAVSAIVSKLEKDKYVIDNISYDGTSEWTFYTHKIVAGYEILYSFTWNNNG